MTSTRPIRALLRGLEVLHVLNLHNGATVSEVASAIDLPRTTTYRILETLCVAGYAYRAASDERYRLTIMVRGLSDGFDDEAWVTQIARPYIYELCNELIWPIAVATLSGSTMLIRQTTDHRSPLADRETRPGLSRGDSGFGVGPRLPRLLFQGATRGHAGHARPLAPRRRQRRRNRKKVYDGLMEIRKRGYAVWHRPRRVSDEISFSVPVLSGDRLLATLTIRFSATAVPESEAAQRFVPKLRAVAQKIGADFTVQSEQDAEATAAVEAATEEMTDS